MSNRQFITTRRNTLGALGAIAAVIPSSVVAAVVCPTDPIFTMIEGHRHARAEWLAAIDIPESAPREAIAVLLGQTKDMTLIVDGVATNIPGGPFYARSRDEIVTHFAAKIEGAATTAERERLENLRAEKLAEWDHREAAAPVVDTSRDDRVNAASDAEHDATVALLTTTPTTLAGAVALLRYIQETDTDGQAYHGTDCGEAGYAFSALIGSLIVSLAPLVSK